MVGMESYDKASDGFRKCQLVYTVAEDWLRVADHFGQQVAT